MLKKLSLKSYAKLNLYLEVLKPRSDGYHDIKTVFEKIGLCDKIVLKARPDKKIKLTCNLPAVPKGQTNLAYRGAQLLRKALHIDQGVDIRIIKHIPVAAGLGGGSSNAASVLLGLNKLWGLALSKNKLARLAANIGSDVPFFIYDYPFAEGCGRGDKIRPLKAISGLRLWHILIVPKFGVSTPLIYKKWDKTLEKNKKAGLTRPGQDVKILTLALKARNSALLRESLFNSLEQVTVRLYPQIGRIREQLLRKGVKSILMSGSGPAVFGICSSKKEALFLYRQLKKDGMVKVFATRTARR
ncbi:MAG: 4-(cytidine 5'-diphospho)-2-C-methyl-D-erythritol kinase [Candidatus Omnitrophica bacterium]|nr:4-(cytidine 5'-diphospho)-2-C-methyl-D-erythritol kinase [Candidatus Omnitrophota bacterium]MDD5592969.1 4-(cytidine 5'-diphospho)-2-C-methyl-D-erythritol kinase [Candidatus Omnitrophota bacterium]